MTAYPGSGEQTIPYDFLNPFGLHTDFKDLVQEGNLELLLRRRDGIQAIVDITSLAKQDQQETERLKTRLVGRIQSYSGDQSYQGAALNQHGGVFNSALDYIDLIAAKAEASPEVVEKLKVAIIKAAMKRYGHVRSFVPDSMEDLVRAAEIELTREVYEQEHATVVH